MNHHPKPTAALLAEIKQLKAALGEIGIVLRGSVTERYMPCGRAGCRCLATPPSLHGPYFQWTTKVEGKTRTVRLRPEEVPLYREWIANGLGDVKEPCASATTNFVHLRGPRRSRWPYQISGEGPAERG